MTTEDDAFPGYLERWRETIELRTEETVAAVSAVPQVVGIILSGSVGRGQAWPLSDIDLIYVAADADDRHSYRKTVTPRGLRHCSRRSVSPSRWYVPVYANG